MSERGPLSDAQVQVVQGRLDANPLFAALMLTHPVEALEQVGVNTRSLDWRGLQAPSSEDAALARRLVTLLRAGLDQLDTPMPVPTRATGLLQVPSPTRAPARPVDVSVSISKGTLRYAVDAFARRSFVGHRLAPRGRPGCELSATAEMLSLELTPGHAHLVARLKLALDFRLELAAGGRYEWRTHVPVSLDALASLWVRDDDLLCLTLSQGNVQLTQVPLPGSLAVELLALVAERVSSIPLMRVPRTFELPGDPDAPDKADVRIAGIGIEEDAATLGFLLEHGPRP